MGLDMYLGRVPAGLVDDDKIIAELSAEDDDENDANEDVEGAEIRKAIDLIENNEIAYWRKFNALHHWLVEHIMNGIDKCQPSRPISKPEFILLQHTLQKAHDTFRQYVDFDSDAAKEAYIKEVVPGVDDEAEYNWSFEIDPDSEVAHKLDEILPPSEGFFFGSQMYSWWYYVDVDRALNVVKEILDRDDFGLYEYRYLASW